MPPGGKPFRAKKVTAGTTNRFDAMLAEANRLNSIHTTYSQSARTGPSSFDCSSSVSDMLHAGGYQLGWEDTDTLAQKLVPGKDPTNRLTVWIKTIAEGGAQAHTFAQFTVNGKTSMWGTNTQHPGHAVSWHVHTTDGFRPYHVNGMDESHDLPANADLSDPTGGGTGKANEGGTGQGQVITATAFATFLDLPGILDTAESLALRGDKSLMNDKPLFPFVEQLCAASLRNFMSLPNGDFFAFYPDYFGGLDHRTPYWEISDIEIIDATIQLSDDALATHVYVVGDIANFDGVNMIDRIQSGGVVTIFNAFMADFLNGLPPDSGDHPNSKKEGKTAVAQRKKTANLANKEAATQFLRKYGARPYYEEAPMVRSPYYEAFLAYQRFCLMWSRQFLTTFEFTFMPELFPGGIVAFPDHGIQCYVDEVVHECDYERGFTTRANLSAPAAIRTNGTVPDDKKFLSAGMIRSFQLDD
jgi:hypothetical protein